MVMGMRYSLPFGLFQVNSVTAGLANSGWHFLINSPTVFDSSFAGGSEKPCGRFA